MEQAMNDYIAIPKSEYDHLKQCEAKLNEIYSSAQNEMQNKINNAFQEAMMMEQKVSNVMSMGINLWY